MHHFFASASRDQTWRLADGAATLIGSRFDAGASAATAHGMTSRFVSSDDVARLCSDFGLGDLTPRIRDGAEIPTGATQIEALGRELPGHELTVRVQATSRIVVNADGEHAHRASMIAVSPARGPAIVTSVERLAGDCRLLAMALSSVAEPGGAGDRPLPLVWRNGTGGVLLHEAAGHPAEEHAPAIRWPGWLEVIDDPVAEGMDRDDTGASLRAADLLSEPPAAMRRESFRDVPLTRMTRLHVRGAQRFDLPESRIEILLTAGGSYDRLTDRVTVVVAAADLVHAGERMRLSPFTLRATRTEVSERLAGAGEPGIRYPGVICSREGQRLFVSTFAPDLLTEAFAT